MTDENSTNSDAWEIPPDNNESKVVDINSKHDESKNNNEINIYDSAQKALNKINSIDVERINTIIYKVEKLVDKYSEKSPISLIGGNMNNFLVLAVVGVIIYFVFIKK